MSLVAGKRCIGNVLRHKGIIPLLVVVLFSFGCGDVTTEPDGVGNDSAEWNKIIWHDFNVPAGQKDAKVVMKLDIVRISPGSGNVAPGSPHESAWVHYNFAPPPPWRDGDILQHFYWWNEQAKAWEGGGFEWWATSVGPQSIMDNVQTGFNKLHIPPSGTKVAFALVKYDGSERSNLATFVWP